MPGEYFIILTIQMFTLVSSSVCFMNRPTCEYHICVKVYFLASYVEPYQLGVVIQRVVILGKGRWTLHSLEKWAKTRGLILRLSQNKNKIDLHARSSAMLWNVLILPVSFSLILHLFVYTASEHAERTNECMNEVNYYVMYPEMLKRHVGVCHCLCTF